MENLIARTSLTSSLEAHMARIVRVAAPLAVVLVVAACAAGSSSPSAVATPEAAPSAADSPVATEQAPSASRRPEPGRKPNGLHVEHLWVFPHGPGGLDDGGCDARMGWQRDAFPRRGRS